MREGGRREILPMKNVHLSVCVTSKEAKNIDATKMVIFRSKVLYSYELWVFLKYPCILAEKAQSTPEGCAHRGLEGGWGVGWGGLGS